MRFSVKKREVRDKRIEHFKLRLMERHNINGNREVRRDIRDQIVTNKSTLVRKLSNNFSLHIVEIHGKYVPVLWDKHHGCPCSAYRITSRLQRRIDEHRSKMGQG